MASHGPNYLEKLFGSKARNALAPLGGVDKVAIALSGKLFIYNIRCINSKYCARKEYERVCDKNWVATYFALLRNHKCTTNDKR